VALPCALSVTIILAQPLGQETFAKCLDLFSLLLYLAIFSSSVLSLDFSMDPYTNALNYLRNLDLGPSARAFDDIDMTFLPNTWSGAHLTHSDQPWPFVFMVR